MGNQKMTNLPEIQFESTVYPTANDIKLWKSLSPELQRAIIARELDEAEKSGEAESASMDDLIERVRARKR